MYLTTILFHALWLFAHPFYVSIAAVDYQENTRSIAISCRIFYDDLEVALRNDAAGNNKVDLINPPDKATIDSLLAGYLRRSFRLSVDNKAISLHYLGYEIEDDVAWCYLEAEAIPSIRRMTIDNSILFRQFPKQSNIIHVTAYGERKSTKLDNPEHQAVFDFQ